LGLARVTGRGAGWVEKPGLQAGGVVVDRVLAEVVLAESLVGRSTTGSGTETCQEHNADIAECGHGKDLGGAGLLGAFLLDEDDAFGAGVANVSFVVGSVGVGFVRHEVLREVVGLLRGKLFFSALYLYHLVI